MPGNKKMIKGKYSCFVVFNEAGFVRATKTGSIIDNNEIEVLVDIKIPPIKFQKTQYIARLEIKEEQIPDIVQELEAKLIELKAGDEP